MLKNPCYNCDKRTAECHSSCNDYLEWNRLHQRHKREIDRERLYDTVYNDAKFNIIQKMRKRKRKRR